VPSLLAEITRVRESVQQLSNVTHKQGRAEEFALRLEQLDGPTDRIRRAVEFLVAIRAEHVAVTEMPAAQGIVAEIGRVKQSYEKDPNLILGPGFVSFSTRLQEAANALEVAARSAWTDLRAQRLTVINQGLLVSLESLPGYASTVSELRRLNAKAATFIPRPLVDSAELSEFLKIAEELRTQWQILCSPDRMPAEVIAFLQGCAEGGAALDLLTAGVREWLADNSIEGQFHIRMGPG
jgi:hypothetical protein